MVSIRFFIGKVWHGLEFDWNQKMGVRDDNDGREWVCERLAGIRLVSTQHPLYFLRIHSKECLLHEFIIDCFRIDQRLLS
jgi:hypothetical protein